MKNFFLVTLAVALLSACAEQPVDPTPVAPVKQIQYTIPYGEHESRQSKPEPVTGPLMSFRAKFDQTAMYNTASPGNQADINKLYGASDCSGFHHINSARFGWRWFNNRLEIWAYVYRNSVRDYKYIDSVPLNVYNDFELSFENEKYIFRVNNTRLEILRYCSGDVTGYKLFPYFGGDEAAPHDVNIWIEEKL